MKIHAKLALAVVPTAVLVACGGGGGGGGGGSASSSPSVPTITGTVATGAPVPNASVAITNTNKLSVCKESAITTGGDGAYTCTLKDGETAPFFVAATDPTGNVPVLVSVTEETPKAGQSAVVNATSLTTAIVGQLNGGDAVGVFNDPTTKYSTTTFQTVRTNVVAQIQPVATALGMSGNFDPINTPITATTHTQSGNVADKMLDVVKVERNGDGVMALSTVDQATSVPLATAGDAGSKLAAPDANVANLAGALNLFAKSFTECFQQAPSARLSSGIVAAACERTVAKSSNSAVGIDFKSNGRSFAQDASSLLSAASMNGVRFEAPEIVAFYPAAGVVSGNPISGRDQAVLNFKYIDANGYAGNVFALATNFPGSNTVSHPSNWWLTGNQHLYDANIKPSVTLWYNAAAGNWSGYRIAVTPLINNKSDAPGRSDYDSVLVKGPGLPTTGLWYISYPNSDLMVLAQQRTAPPVNVSSLSVEAGCERCISFKFSRTKNYTGADASVLKVNMTGTSWAQGASEGSYNGVSGTRPKKGDAYAFAFYKNTVLVRTETHLLRNDLVDVTKASELGWHAPKKGTVDGSISPYLNPSDATNQGAISSMSFGWTVSPIAEPIWAVGVTQANYTMSDTPVKPGVTSVTATAKDGVTFTSFTTSGATASAPENGHRQVDMYYRMNNGSSKFASFVYWP